MSYQTKRQKIIEKIESIVIPALQKNDLDYGKVVTVLCDRASASENMVEDCLKTYIRGNKIQEIHILTIPDDTVEGWVDDMISEEKKAEKQLKEMEFMKDGNAKKR